MFGVRSAPCPFPICSRALALHATYAVAPGLLARTLAPHTVCPPFGSRQYASAFNQPLSFDTSSVTAMYRMFIVRSSPCPTPNLQSSPPLHAACTADAFHLLPPGPNLAQHCMPSFRLSAVRVSVQPAGELRHLQRHEHGLHVRGALRPMPCPQSAVEPSPCTLLTPPSSAAFQPLARTLAPLRMPSFRLSAVCVGVQPAAELRHLQRHEHARHVRGALLPVACPQSAVEPSPCTLRVPLSSAFSRLLARTSPRTVCPLFDSRQQSSAFNQPLSFDTSSVTAMYYMFAVRSSPWPAPTSAVEPSPLPAACAAVVCMPPSRLQPAPSPRSECPPFDSRQGASAFNQPLSFDTSSVTNMDYMFSVRSSPCPGPQSAVEPSPCTLLTPRSPAAYCLPGRTSPGSVCHALRSALGSKRRRSTSR